MTLLYLKHLLCISPFVPFTSGNKLYYTMIYWLLKTVLNMHIFGIAIVICMYILYIHMSVYMCVYKWMDVTHTVHFHQGT